MDNTRLQKSDMKMITNLSFRLLPIQVLLAMINAINGIVSGIFASNFIGSDAMGAVGLYSPLALLIGAIAMMLVGGSQILCGEFKGKNLLDRTQDIFSLDIIISTGFSVLMIAFVLLSGIFDLTGIFTKDPVIRPLFNQYLIGMSIGILPQILGQQLSGFLSLENQTKRTFAASIAYILINLVLNYIFVGKLRMEAFGLALASSIGLWIFFLVQARYFVSKKAVLRFKFKNFKFSDSKDIIRIGAPGALSFGYQAIRGLVLNSMILGAVGSAGLSAFSACNSFMPLFWAIPSGMMAVSRMLISVSVGEEDRQTLKDIMRVVFYRYIPLMCIIAAGIIIFARPIARMYFHDEMSDVFIMTMRGFRIIPFCMPLSVICMHFTCYGQAMNKQVLIHSLALLDGVVNMVVCSAVMMPFFGMDSIYYANICNGTITVLFVLFYAWICNKHFPKNMDDLLVIPKDFGYSEESRMDISVDTIEEVTSLAESVQRFCEGKGIEGKRAKLAGLAIEEMAGNIVVHGFTKDKKKHSIDVRVAEKDGSLILRIKDDCIAFDPSERKDISDPEDPVKNIGIRMIYSMAKSVQYQNILGLNVLTIRI